mgnify:CR=1 FL=1
MKAKEITDRRQKSFASTTMTGESGISYVGSVIGVSLGTTYILNVVIYTNMAYVVGEIEKFWFAQAVTGFLFFLA